MAGSFLDDYTPTGKVPTAGSFLDEYENGVQQKTSAGSFLDNYDPKNEYGEAPDTKYKNGKWQAKGALEMFFEDNWNYLKGEASNIPNEAKRFWEQGVKATVKTGGVNIAEGIHSFVTSIPGITVGLMGAMERSANATLSGRLNINEIYEEGKKGFEESKAWMDKKLPPYQPRVAPESSAYMQEIAFSPFEAPRRLAKEIADAKIDGKHILNPNTRGIIKILGDLAGMKGQHMLSKGMKEVAGNAVLGTDRRTWDDFSAELAREEAFDRDVLQGIKDLEHAKRSYEAAEKRGTKQAEAKAKYEETAKILDKEVEAQVKAGEAMKKWLDINDHDLSREDYIYILKDIIEAKESVFKHKLTDEQLAKVQQEAYQTINGQKTRRYLDKARILNANREKTTRYLDGLKQDRANIEKLNQLGTRPGQPTMIEGTPTTPADRMAIEGRPVTPEQRMMIQQPQPPATREIVPMSEKNIAGIINTKDLTPEARDAAAILEPETTNWVREIVDINSLMQKNRDTFENPDFKPETYTNEPVLIGKNGDIIDGNNRVRRAYDAGQKQIEVYRPSNVHSNPTLAQQILEGINSNRQATGMAPLQSPKQLKQGPHAYEGPGYVTTQVSDIQTVTKAGKTVDNSKFTINIDEEYSNALNDVVKQVEQGEPGKRMSVGEGAEKQWFGVSSTYPDFMLDQEWKAKEVIKAIKSAKEGKKLGIRQTRMVEKALEYIDEQRIADLERRIKDGGISERDIAEVSRDAKESALSEVAEEIKGQLDEAKRESASGNPNAQAIIDDWTDFLTEQRDKLPEGRVPIEKDGLSLPEFDGLKVGKGIDGEVVERPYMSSIKVTFDGIFDPAAGMEGVDIPKQYQWTLAGAKDSEKSTFYTKEFSYDAARDAARKTRKKFIDAGNEMETIDQEPSKAPGLTNIQKAERLQELKRSMDRTSSLSEGERIARAKGEKVLDREAQARRQAYFDLQNVLYPDDFKQTKDYIDPADMSVSEATRVGIEMISDLNTLMKDIIKGEEGSLDFGRKRPMTLTEQAAALRLTRNFRLAEQIARDTGQRVAKVLQDVYNVHPEVAKKIDQQMNPVNKESAISDLIEGTDAMFEQQRQRSLEVRRMSPSQIKKALVRKFVDVSGNLERELYKQKTDTATDVIMDMNLRRGASGQALQLAEAIKKPIYKGLGKKLNDLFDEMVQSTRITEIDKYSRYLVKRKPTMKMVDGELQVVSPARIERRFGSLQEAQEYINAKDKKAKNYTVEEFKNPGGYKGEDHLILRANFIEKIKRRLGVGRAEAEKIYVDLQQREKMYFDAFKGILNEMYTEGLLDEASYNSLNKYRYQPREFLEMIDPHGSFGKGGKSVPDSGIQRLTGGDVTALEIDSERLLDQYIARATTRIFNNRANKSLLKFATENPENGFVKVLKGNEKLPPKTEGITAMVDGQPKRMAMTTEMSREWLKYDPVIDSGLVELASWALGSKIMKATATGYNPGFIFTNLPRDLAHIYASTKEYSPTLPVAATQMGMDMARVAWDSVRRKGRWLDYVREGGSMDFLANQAKVDWSAVPGKFPKLKRRLHTIAKAMSYLNETSEILTRLALRERAMKNMPGKENASRRATWIARNYLDFSKGGNYTKASEVFFPYMNASIQATRGLVRAAKDNPTIFAYKMAQLGALSTGLYIANRFINPEAYDKIDDRTKESYFIITTPWKMKDSTGKDRDVYFKVAKDQGQRAVTAAFEGLAAMDYEGKYPTERVIMGAEDFFSFLPMGDLAPTLSAFYGYISNRDFWRKREIWNTSYGYNVHPNKEYRADTPPFFVQLGKMTADKQGRGGLSPERMKYALSKFFVPTNPYVAAVGYGYKGALNLIGSEEMKNRIKREDFQNALRNISGLQRIISLAPAEKWAGPNSERKMIDKDEASRKWVQKMEFDEVGDAFIDNPSKENLSKVLAHLKANVPVDERKSYLKSLSNDARMRDVPYRNFWRDLQFARTPEGRAAMFMNEYRNANDKKKAQLTQTLISKQVPGIVTDRFVKSLAILMKKERGGTQSE